MDPNSAKSTAGKAEAIIAVVELAIGKLGVLLVGIIVACTVWFDAYKNLRKQL